MTSRKAANALIAAFCLLGYAWITLPSAVAQPYAPIASPNSPDWGDPYQMVAPANETLMQSGLNALPSGVFQTGLFSGGKLFQGGLFGHSTRYSATPTATQLNNPMVGMPSQGNVPILDGPIFEGGPVYNSMGERNRLFPGVRSRISSRLYLRSEYLIWNATGMNAPPMVTTSPTGTPQDTAAVLGEPGTSVLFGGNEINGGAVNGILFGGGMWLTTARNAAIEIESFQLASLSEGYNGASDGSLILGRPFFDTQEGEQSALLISYPDLVSGSINIANKSELRSFLIDGRFRMCPNHTNNCQQCGLQERTDWIIGYRYIRLRDSTSVNTDLDSLIPDIPGSVAATDQFQTQNEFSGLQLGFMHRSLFKRAWLDSQLRVALGNNRQTVQIGGSTTYDELGVIDTFPGGLLAQRTNSGERKRDEFVMVPELGFRLGMRWTERFHTTLGYSVLYLPNVVRSVEQIDTDLNPELIPEEVVPFTGALRPQAIWVQSDYIAHGVHLGAELHF